MSKQNPNQDFYKIQGRDQSDGPDRAVVHKYQKHELAQNQREAEHPAVKRSAKKKK